MPERRWSSQSTFRETLVRRLGKSHDTASSSSSLPLVCCETHKFSERVQTDAFVYNEIGSPDDLVPRETEFGKSSLHNWRANPYLTPLHLYYDITPPELVTAVITEIAILPCTSVPVILRIKPTEIGY
uniref:Translation initiation factor eIF2B subunit delta n=1 Tax=Phlebotomus papatasi TaxID=29031 RepID=A0A1B0DJN1_PHLPP